jgi:hypothetical protein
MRCVAWDHVRIVGADLGGHTVDSEFESASYAVARLLILVRVSVDLLSLLEEHLCDHHALAGSTYEEVHTLESASLALIHLDNHGCLLPVRIRAVE